MLSVPITPSTMVTVAPPRRPMEQRCFVAKANADTRAAETVSKAAIAVHLRRGAGTSIWAEVKRKGLFFTKEYCLVKWSNNEVALLDVSEE